MEVSAIVAQGEGGGREGLEGGTACNRCRAIFKLRGDRDRGIRPLALASSSLSQHRQQGPVSRVQGPGFRSQFLTI